MLRAKVKPVIDEYAASVGEATVKALMAENETVRKQGVRKGMTAVA
ncbi:hypothetical protein ABL840_20370 [Variovorax sp. NFACC27]